VRDQMDQQLVRPEQQGLVLGLHRMDQLQAWVPEQLGRRGQQVLHRTDRRLASAWVQQWRREQHQTDQQPQGRLGVILKGIDLCINRANRWIDHRSRTSARCTGFTRNRFGESAKQRTNGRLAARSSRGSDWGNRSSTRAEWISGHSSRSSTKRVGRSRHWCGSSWHRSRGSCAERIGGWHRHGCSRSGCTTKRINRSRSRWHRCWCWSAAKGINCCWCRSGWHWCRHWCCGSAAERITSRIGRCCRNWRTWRRFTCSCCSTRATKRIGRGGWSEWITGWRRCGRCSWSNCSGSIAHCSTSQHFLFVASHGFEASRILFVRIASAQQSRIAAKVFQGHSIATLNAFERTADGIDVAGLHFICSTFLEISLGFVRPTELAECQRAEVIDPGILAAAVDRFGQKSVGLCVVAGKIIVHASAVKFVQQLILRPAHRGAQQAAHRRR
jgi:hypothetical protein